MDRWVPGTREAIPGHPPATTGAEGQRHRLFERL